MIIFHTTNHKKIIALKSQSKFLKLFKACSKFSFNKKFQNLKEFLFINDICSNQIKKIQIMIKISNVIDILWTILFIFNSSFVNKDKIIKKIIK